MRHALEKAKSSKSNITREEKSAIKISVILLSSYRQQRQRYSGDGYVGILRKIGKSIIWGWLLWQWEYGTNLKNKRKLSFTLIKYRQLNRHYAVSYIRSPQDSLRWYTVETYSQLQGPDRLLTREDSR